MSQKEKDLFKFGYIDVDGARVHNLKNVSLKIPKNKLSVITGISGSGKSSLAFDTIYAEGQRRYMETFSTYARQFMGKLERPDVEMIEGLSPVIAIEQKTTGWNPRSTVGTTTELYDFLRLLFARASDAHSYVTGKKMVRYSQEQIIDYIFKNYNNKKLIILAPLVKGRKGHYRELFEQMRKKGYTKIRVDGEILDIIPSMQIDRYKIHDIELVVDRLKVSKLRRERLVVSSELALNLGSGIILLKEHDSDEIKSLSKHLMCPESGIAYEEPSPNSFSFNSPYGTCPVCKGLGNKHQADIDKIIPDDSKSINEIGIKPFGEVRDTMSFRQLKDIAKKYKFTFDTPISKIPKEAMNIILNGGDKGFGTSVKYSKNEMIYNLAYEGLINMLERWFGESTSERIRNWAEDYLSIVTCPECNGYRLKKSSLHYKIDGKNIGELAQMDLSDLVNWFEKIEDRLSKKQNLIAKDVIKEIRERLGFLMEVGLDYISLDRPTMTLSGGESQRTRLATQIGSQLTGITYILDEPSIGLHQRDNHRLINALKDLTYIGNTVLVVEHDKDIMLESDYLIDIGPGAGQYGGEIVAAGIPSDFYGKDSVTAAFLEGKLKIEIPKSRRKGTGNKLVLTSATGNNLDNVKLTIPLGKAIVVTGVSGSGKSTLINDTLYPILRKHFYRSTQRPLPYGKISGLKNIDKVIEIDQSPIGRTPRSNPATYTKMFGFIRKIFSELPESKIRGYKPGRFSFNVVGGRCETCKGGGMQVIEMNFLPDVLVECDTCMGKRYNRETLEILYKGKTISQVLEMSIGEALPFFKHIPSIHRKIKILHDVGLDYITLGQQATTLSGGEAQRVKLGLELSKKDTGNTLYILDEPTTGLHFSDVKMLINVINKLVNKGNTVIIIEHNMDIIKIADHIIDLGPEGGKGGGKIIFEGTPEKMIKLTNNHTARYLKDEFC